ncbi:MAG TPA: hypothetical protein VIM79_01065 [Niastella sp.]
MFQFQKPYSEETGKLIHEEVRKLINTSYQQTKTLLQQNKESLVKVAEKLAASPHYCGSIAGATVPNLYTLAY